MLPRVLVTLRGLHMLGIGHCLLIVGSLVGFVAQTAGFRSYYAVTGRGDGWSELGPGVAIFVFSPLQLWAAIAVVLAYIHRPRAKRPAGLTPVSEAYGLEHAPEKAARAERAARAVMWTVTGPALVMLLCVLDELLRLDLPLIGLLAGPMAVLWTPLWAASVIAAVSAMNADAGAGWLLWSASYPLLVVWYGHL
ncbi:MAG: hypothetical protein ABW321_01280 [Polyangiales bacterium]